MESDQMESREDTRPAVIVRLRKFLSSGISYVSVRRKDSQGCTADDKDTHPSPKEKPDDLIGPDIDPVGDHDDLMATGRTLSAKSGFHITLRQQSLFMMATRSVEAFGSGLTLMSDSFFRPRQHSLPRMVKRRTLSEPVKSVFHIPLRQQSPLMRVMRSVEAFGSGLTLMNDSFIRPRQHSLPRTVLKSMEAFGSGLSLMNDSFIRTGQRSLLRPDDLIGPDIDHVGDHDDLSDFFSSEEEDVSDDEDLVDSSDDLMATGSMKSFNSGVSLKSDWSNGRMIDFKDRVSPRRVDSSLSEKKHDVTYVEDWIKRLDDLTVLKSMEAFGSSLSLMNDSFIRTGQRSLLREEMNQELSSEVGWKHG